MDIIAVIIIIITCAQAKIFSFILSQCIGVCVCVFGFVKYNFSFCLFGHEQATHTHTKAATMSAQKRFTKYTILYLYCMCKHTFPRMHLNVAVAYPMCIIIKWSMTAYVELREFTILQFSFCIIIFYYLFLFLGRWLITWEVSVV